MKMLVFLISLSASLMVPVLSSERIYTYTDAIPQTSNWVGQQVMFSVVIAMDERPQGSPRFTIPDVPGGILLEISGRPTYGKEKKNGAEFSTWRYDFPEGLSVKSPMSANAVIYAGRADNLARYSLKIFFRHNLYPRAQNTLCPIMQSAAVNSFPQM